MLGISPLEWLAWLDSPQMAIVAQEKSAKWPRTVPNSSYLAKVAAESTPGLPDVGDLPLGVVSLAGLSSDGRSGLALP